MAKVNVSEMNGNEILDMLEQLRRRTVDVEANAQDAYDEACGIAIKVCKEEELRDRGYDAEPADPTITNNITSQVISLLKTIGFVQTGNNDYSIKTRDGDGRHPETCVHIHITRNHAPSVYDSRIQETIRCKTVSGANRLYEAYASRAKAQLAIGTTTSKRTVSLITALSRRVDSYNEPVEEE
jgi:hypothetical protein